jgi:hypothetical protein
MKTAQKLLIALTILLASASGIYAAELTTVAGLTYSDATILEATKATIRFKFNNDTTVTKALCEIKKIQTGEVKEFDAAEELLAAGKSDQALPLYQTVMTSSKNQTVVTLCLARMENIKDKATSADASSKPAATTAPSPAKATKCPLCKGTGSIACTACLNSGGLATGLGKCEKCSGKGLVTCSNCRGAYGVVCSTCAGTGTMMARQGETHVEAGKCKDCGGTGYKWWAGVPGWIPGGCPKCFYTPNRGKMPCLECKGSGRSGQCPICNGTKKAVCPKCHGEVPKDPDAAPAAKGPADPATTPAAPAGPSAANIPTKDEALASPDALKIFLQLGGPRHPQKDGAQWDKMTSMAQDAAMEKYHKDMAAWQANKDFKGKTITWTMALVDLQKADSGLGYVAKLASPDGFVLPVAIPASSKDDIVSWKKDDRIVVTGKLDDYGIADEGEGILGERRLGLSVKLLDTSAKLAGK